MARCADPVPLVVGTFRLGRIGPSRSARTWRRFRNGRWRKGLPYQKLIASAAQLRLGRLRRSDEGSAVVDHDRRRHSGDCTVPTLV